MQMSKQTAHTQDEGRFEARMAHFGGDLCDALAALYGDRADFADWQSRLTALIQQAYEARPDHLKAMDEARADAPTPWYQDAKMLGYMCYPDRFAGDFGGVKGKIPYLQDLGVTYLHLLSVLKARRGDSDGGFAIADYLSTNENLGSIDDLEALITDLREAGISLCLDFVFNHTAREHEWAQRAIAGEKAFQDFYFMYPDRKVPDQVEPLLDEVFPETAPGNFTYVEDAEKWVWTTFYPYQWDLNYHNPAVLLAMLDNLFQLANRGVEIFRLDAAIYVWKELGTHCRNLPETHVLIQLFRAAAAIVAPGVALKAEAMAGARHITKYFGYGDKAGKECQLAYHNAAMAALWDSLATGNAKPAYDMLSALPGKPEGTSWVYYARCHDDIGWAALRDSTGASWGAADDHLNWLWRFYAGEVEGSFARGRRFQPVPGEAFAGSNGTLASLAGLEEALEVGDDTALDLAVRRILLLHAVPMALDGIPLIYMGDELTLLNDYGHADNPAHQDGRWLHRPVMPDGLEGFTPDHQSAFARVRAGLRSLIKARKHLPFLGSMNGAHYVEAGNDHVLAFVRPAKDEAMLCLANFSAKEQSVDAGFIEEVLGASARDISPLNGICGRRLSELGPYQCRWILGERTE